MTYFLFMYDYVFRSNNNKNYLYTNLENVRKNVEPLKF